MTETSPQVTLGQTYPEPSFASVRVEFSDGTFREFHVHKPLRAEVVISPRGMGLDLTADLGVFPAGMMPPELPEVEVRMKAGYAPNHQVMTMDSRVPDARTDMARVLSLICEAADLRRTYGSDDEGTISWRSWEARAEAFLMGGYR